MKKQKKQPKYLIDSQFGHYEMIKITGENMMLSKKEYYDKQFNIIKNNLSEAMNVMETEGLDDKYTDLYATINDTMIRIEGMEHYGKSH